jgi:peptidoglycan/LPS O-acetylase OafA/YrhL
MMHLQMRDYNNRIFGLDALRAFAVLCVVYAHGYRLTNQVILEEVYNLPVFDGVTMFFVLSGFLIGRILLRMFAKDDLNAKMLVEFWIRRWFRTLPNYFFVLIVLIIAYHLSSRPLPENLIEYFIFSQNFASPHPNFYPEAWSLAVEEWFYLVMPMLLYLLAKVRKVDRANLMLICIVAVILLVTAFRCYRAYTYGYVTVDEWDMALRKQVVTRLDSLMFGVLGAYLSLYNQSFWKRMASSGFVIGIFVLLFDKFFFYATHSIFYLNYFKLTLSAVGTLLLLPKLSTMKCNVEWLVTAVTFISLISYSMYLINLTPILKITLPAIMVNLTGLYWYFDQHIYIVQYVIYWMITLTGSFLLYNHFERPMTSLRDKYHFCGQRITAFPNHDVNIGEVEINSRPP